MAVFRTEGITSGEAGGKERFQVLDQGVLMMCFISVVSYFLGCDCAGGWSFAEVCDLLSLMVFFCCRGCF